MTTQQQNDHDANNGKGRVSTDTREDLRPPDDAVATSDFIGDAAGAHGDTEDDAGKAASGDDKSAGTDDQNSATGNSKTRKRGDRKIQRLQRALDKRDGIIQKQGSQISDLTARLEKLEGGGGDDNPEPKFDDFNDPKDYAKAYAKWEASQSSSSSTGRQQQQQQRQTSDDQRPHASEKELAAFVKAGQAQLGDEFMEAMKDGDAAIDQAMGEFIFDSDYGPAIYVHLANNPEESQKIFDSSTRRKTRALEALEEQAKKGELDVDGEIKLKVAGDDDEDDDTDDENDKGSQADAGNSGAGQQTKAGDPPSDTRDGSSTGTADVDLQTASMDDYAATRRKQEAARRR